METSIAVLTASVSRNAGGLYDAIRSACLNMPGSLEVFGLRDTYTDLDRHGWGSLKVHVYRTRAFHSFGYAPELWKDLSQGDYELLHIHGLWMYPQFVSLKWQKRFGRPVVISVHGMLNTWAVRHSSWKKKLVRMVFASKSLATAACLHALSEGEYRAIRQYGLKNPVAIIPNGIELPPDEGKRVQGTEKKTLLYLGRLHPIKGLDLLIEALGLLADSGSEFLQHWEVKIVGSGQPAHQEMIEKEVINRDLEDVVFFLGPLYDREKAEVLRSASAFILPSHSEGLPMSVLEAWSYKLPVLMTRECNLSEGFEAKAAIELDLNAAGMAGQLDKLGQMTPSQLDEMAENGYQLVRTKFNWKKIALDFEATYKWLLMEAEKPEFVVLD